jgi:hypothetical protein
MQTCIPLEVIYHISRHINLIDYLNLRQTAKHFYKLDKIPQLSYKTYKESTEILKSDLQINHRIHLQLDDISNEAFCFIVLNNHTKEFSRIMKSRKSHLIPTIIKQKAMSLVMKHDLNPSMIIDLLIDGKANPAINVPFSCNTEKDEIANTLNWAAYKGHVEVLKILLNDPRVNVVTDVDNVGDSSGIF